MRRWGMEAEYLLENRDIADVLKLGVPGVSAEFFQCMVEVVTKAHGTITTAVHELQKIVEELESRGVSLHPYASWSYDEPWDKVQWQNVTSHTDYYEWVFFTAVANPMELHHVGIHLNVSDSLLSGDELIRAANWLRCLAFLFILFTSNSPIRNNSPAGCLSRRSYWFPNRYDVPLWKGEKEFRQWLRKEEETGRIFPGKARAWMSVCPRVAENCLYNPIDRLEVRCLDSGRNLSWEIISGCCELVERIIIHASLATDFLPVQVSDLYHNDKAVAHLGRLAQVRIAGQWVSVLEVAKEWCTGIAALEDVLLQGSSAERSLASLEQRRIA